jgi:hypothetical protein
VKRLLFCSPYTLPNQHYHSDVYEISSSLYTTTSLLAVNIYAHLHIHNNSVESINMIVEKYLQAVVSCITNSANNTINDTSIGELLWPEYLTQILSHTSTGTATSNSVMSLFYTLLSQSLSTSSSYQLRHTLILYILKHISTHQPSIRQVVHIYTLVQNISKQLSMDKANNEATIVEVIKIVLTVVCSNEELTVGERGKVLAMICCLAM